jgi:hypothetical protein
MLETIVEQRLKRLEKYGFLVLKLKTPGYNGTMDRLILRPKYSPGAPWVLEVKQPGKSERALQEAVRDDWRLRGVLVLDVCDTVQKVDALVDTLVNEVKWLEVYRAYNGA